jgi:hypothetical protein
MNETKFADHASIVAAAHELAVEFFRGIYGEHSVVPKEKMYDLPAYPCWALACHAYEKLVGIDPEKQRRGDYWVPSGNFSLLGDKEIPLGIGGDWSILGDKQVHLSDGRINGQLGLSPLSPWQDHVIDNARNIERECQ